jgi:hypothetical protein
MRTLLLSVALLASACGSWCDNYESVQRSRAQKDVDCTNGTVAIAYNDMKCEQRYVDSCTAGDQRKLNDWLGCYDAILPCKKGSEGNFNTAKQICDDKLSGMSLQCAAIFLPF